MATFKQDLDIELLATYRKKLKTALNNTLDPSTPSHEYWLYPEHAFHDAPGETHPLFLVDFSVSLVKRMLGDPPVKGQLRRVGEEIALSEEKGRLNRRKLNVGLKRLKIDAPAIQMQPGEDDGDEEAPARPAAATPLAPAGATSRAAAADDVRRAALKAQLAQIASSLPAAVPALVDQLLQRIQQDLDNGQLDKAELGMNGLATHLQRPKTAPVRGGFKAAAAGAGTKPAAVVPATPVTPAATSIAVAGAGSDETRRARLEARRSALNDALGMDLPPASAQALTRLQVVLARTDLKPADLDNAERALQAVVDIIARQKGAAPAGFAAMPNAAAAAAAAAGRAAATPPPVWYAAVQRAEGVEDWFLDVATRKSPVEKLTEEFFAFVSLIEMKSRGKDVSALLTRVQKGPPAVMNASGRADNAVAAKNAKELGEAWKAFKAAEREKDALRGDLRALWLNDQRKRLADLGSKAQKAKKRSVAHDMARAYGEEAMLEMAQMAEVQAANKGADPNKDAERLDTGEKAAIYGYSTADYADINQVMRSDAPDPAKQQKYAAYIEAGIAGLSKLPNVPGGMKVIRCDKKLHPMVVKGLLQSGTRSERSFLSSGTSKIPGFGDLEMHITGIKTGKNIKMFSLHQKEDEVLFPPGSTFRFTGGQFRTADGRTVSARNHAELTEADLLSATSGVFNFVQAS